MSSYQPVAGMLMCNQGSQNVYLGFCHEDPTMEKTIMEPVKASDNVHPIILKACAEEQTSAKALEILKAIHESPECQQSITGISSSIRIPKPEFSEDSTPLERTIAQVQGIVDGTLQLPPPAPRPGPSACFIL